MIKRLLINFMRQSAVINSFKYSRICNYVRILLIQRPLTLTNSILPVTFAISIIKKSDKEHDEEYDIDQLIEEADTFHENSQIKEAWIVLKSFTETNESELLWRIGYTVLERLKENGYYEDDL